MAKLTTESRVNEVVIRYGNLLELWRKVRKESGVVGSSGQVDMGVRDGLGEKTAILIANLLMEEDYFGRVAVKTRKMLDAYMAEGFSREEAMDLITLGGI